MYLNIAREVIELIICAAAMFELFAIRKRELPRTKMITYTLLRNISIEITRINTYFISALYKVYR